MLKIALFITAFGNTIPLVLLTLALCIFFLLRRKRLAMRILATTYLGGEVFVHLLKMLFGRTRPDILLHQVEVFSYSFPSGHAFLTAALGTSLVLILFHERSTLNREVLFGAILFSFAVGISRVIVGVHYLSDVIGGWIFGIIFAWLLVRLFVRAHVRPSAL